MARESHTPLLEQPLYMRRNRRLCRANILIPLLFIATIVAAFIVMMGETQPDASYLKYTAVTGYFLQDEPSTDPKTFDFTTTNFGLIDRSYSSDISLDSSTKLTQWERFEHHVSQLNDQGVPTVTYKVLFLGRHGQGYHNVAESFYGTHAWDCYWSLQPGNSTSTWSDALLTPVGEAQALKVNAFWRLMIQEHKIPCPEAYYVSPLLRCLATANLTFSGLELLKDRPFRPLIKEKFREANGVHTCDRRSSKSVIQTKYPDWKIEDGFSEEDLLWDPVLRETDLAQDHRAKEVFDEVFETEERTWISISSHSGQIAAALRVLAHRPFGLWTGQVIPVLVKIEKVAGTMPPVEKAPWFKPETCSKPPAMLS